MTHNTRSRSSLIILTLSIYTVSATSSKSTNRFGNSPINQGPSSDLLTLAAQAQCDKTRYESEYPCGDGFFTVENMKTCLHFSEDTKIRDKAQEECTNRHGDLVYIPDRGTDSVLSGWKNFSTDAWIGINNIISLGQWKWYPDRHVTFENWFEKLDPSPFIYHCVVKSPSHGGQWVKAPCDSRQRYICERPRYNTRVSVDFKPKQGNKIIVGANALVTCTIKGISFEQVIFEMLPNKLQPSVIKYLAGEDKRITKRLQEYIEEEGVCFVVSRWILEVRILYAYTGRVMKCCGVPNNGTAICATGDDRGFSPEVAVQKPSVQVTYHQGVTVADCFAVVGVSGIIMWYLAGPIHAWQFQILTGPFGSDKPKTVVDGVSVILRKSSFDEERGMALWFQMNITQRRELEGLSFACDTQLNPKVHNLSQLLEDTPSRSEIHSLPLTVPQPPEVLHNLKYSEDGVLSTLACSAYVGKAGVLTWYFEQGNVTGVWPINTESGRDLDMRSAPEGATVLGGTAYSTYGYEKGTHIASTIHVNLTRVKDKKDVQVIACLSQNLSDPENFLPTKKLAKSVTFDFRDSGIDDDNDWGFGSYLYMILAVPLLLTVLLAALLVLILRKAHADGRISLNCTGRREESVNREEEDRGTGRRDESVNREEEYEGDESKVTSTREGNSPVSFTASLRASAATSSTSV